MSIIDEEESLVSHPGTSGRPNRYDRFVMLGLIPAAPFVIGIWAVLVKGSVAAFFACLVASVALSIGAYFRKRRLDQRWLEQ